MLAKLFVDKILKDNHLSSSKLINILPIGGWENVLKFEKTAFETNTFGIGTNVFAILDGDIKGNSKLKDYQKLQYTFLPISSIEKYLLHVFTDPSYKALKKEINDTFFNVKSVDEILASYTKDGDNNGKALYRKLISDLESRTITEDIFAKDLCNIIIKYVDVSDFIVELKHRLGIHD